MSGMRLFGLSLAALASACAPGDDRQAQDAAGQQPLPAASGSAAPAPAAPRVDAVTCDYPVKPGDTAASLRARYGSAARIETLAGPEGLDFEGMALWPDDPRRRVEVIFGEDASGKASAVRLWDESRWRVAGIGIGDPLAKVREANAGPFDVGGFYWDYGGYVSDLKGGKLAGLPGGCALSVRFDPAEDADLPSDMMGEVTLSSEDSRMGKARARVSELTLQLPDGRASKK